MPTIQETISRIINVEGPNIFKNKKKLCIAIEDLAPSLCEEIDFINKVYNDNVGQLIYETIVEDDIEKKKDLLREVDKYLDEKSGINANWRNRLLLFFQKPVLDYSNSKAEKKRERYQTSDEEIFEYKRTEGIKDNITTKNDVAYIGIVSNGCSNSQQSQIRESGQLLTTDNRNNITTKNDDSIIGGVSNGCFNSQQSQISDSRQPLTTDNGNNIATKNDDSFIGVVGNSYSYSQQSQSSDTKQRGAKAKFKDFIILALCFAVGILTAIILMDKIVKKHQDEQTSISGEVIRKEETYIPAEENEEPAVINAKVGDIIEFGTYEQDGNLENGSESIEWIVLDKNDERMLLISRYILDAMPYDERKEDVSWETCELRNWLNSEFYSISFSDNEKERIKSVTISNPDNMYYETKGGEDTIDKVFCLNVEEILEYYDFDTWYEKDQYGYCQALIAEVTQYAKDNGAYIYKITKEDYDSFLASEGYDSSCIDQECGWWWLRSPGIDGGSVNDVSDYGSAGWGSRYIEADVNHGVRPAIYIRLDEGGVSLDEAEVGDTVSFGTYEQDADDKNGKEDIYWTVFDEKDDRMLLVSNRILDYKPYNDDIGGEITWENCTTRKWLNEEFYQEAFSSTEKNRIVETELDNPSSYEFYQTSYMSDRWSWWQDGDLKGSGGGSDTVDKVFLLSYEEALEYFEDENRMVVATESVIEKGIYVMQVEEYEEKYIDIYTERCIGNSKWWLRSPAWDAEHIMLADYDGRLNAGRIDGDWFGIRPAIWIRKER